ncbi:ribosome biogenesis GTPase Der [Patescibacteria group bacterium]|nr:MAG: ribosome biogenesis GTPase Der [Patescibacteria group bacterium]
MPSRRVLQPTIALVGRTNVGKSTLFNRILEEDRALVSEEPHTTRDRNYGVLFWRGSPLQIVDTGGLDTGEEALAADITHQAEIAMEEADCILFVVDLQTGLLPQDLSLARNLAKSKKPVILVGNKADNPKLRLLASDREWQKLRLGAPAAVSAKNGTGVGDLLDQIFVLLKIEKEAAELPATKIAIIGRPNVGKSSLVNCLAREERQIVSPIPGTTREPEDTLIEINGEHYLLIDTVGLRRHRAEPGTLEHAGVKRTARAIERAEVLFLVLDALEPLTSQDRSLAGLAKESGKAVVLVVNKWDTVKEKTVASMERARERLYAELPFFRFAPIRFISAKTGEKADSLFLIANEVKARWRAEIPAKLLDSFFRREIKKAKGPARPYIYSFRQTGAEPPTFALAVRGKEPPAPAFLRYLENRLRRRFDFTGTPLRLRAKNVQVRP